MKEDTTNKASVTLAIETHHGNYKQIWNQTMAGGLPTNTVSDDDTFVEKPSFTIDYNSPEEGFRKFIINALALGAFTFLSEHEIVDRIEKVIKALEKESLI